MTIEPKQASIPDAAVSHAASEVTSAQPTRTVERDGARYTLLGTAHVSKTSAQEVQRLLATGQFDAVAVELDPGRHAAMTEPERWAKMDLFKVIREGKAGMVAAQLALGAFQQRLADQFGVEPGAEMRAALHAAKDQGIPVLLIDRDVGVTLRRVYAGVPWWRRFTLLAGLLTSVVSKEEIREEDIEKLKEGDMLEATFTEFAEEASALYTPLIAERDRYMAARLREEQAKEPHDMVLVVVGAGHLAGLTRHLEAPSSVAPAVEREALERIPPPNPWLKLLPWVLVALLLTGFAIAFMRGPELGFRLVAEWLLLNGGLAALGTAVALGHPLTVLAAFVGAPLATLHPLLGIGMLTAGVELWVRKPRVGDFSTLRNDVTEPKGWWRNRVARTLLVFFLSTLGAVIGNYIAGFRIFGRLFG